MSTISSIGIVALSSPTTGKSAQRVRKAIASLERKGLRVCVGASVFQKQSYRSTNIQTRVKDLMELFSDDSVDCILSTNGGFNSNELLEYLDYEVIRKNPKWFVGYSDITAVNLALYAKAGLPSVNGPLLVDVVDDAAVFDRLFKQLNARKINFTMPKTLWEWDGKDKRKTPRLRSIPGKTETVTGPVLAGNLSTFVLILGTPYMPNPTGNILFLEYDVCEAEGLPSLQRMLWQLRQNGFFAKIKGLVLGTLPAKTKKEERKNWTLADILAEVTDGFDFPIVYDAPFGHIYPSWVLVNGMKCEVTASFSGENVSVSSVNTFKKPLSWVR